MVDGTKTPQTLPVVVPSENESRQWRQELKAAVRDPIRLCRHLQLPASWDAAALVATEQFPLLAPWPYVQRMQPGNPADPLLLQVLPLAEETLEIAGFGTDPVGDQAAQRDTGLLHKYAGRALLITTGACAVHCRYCFRRHFPYEQAPKSLAAWQAPLETIAQDPTIEEVILSGGDPLVLTDGFLAQLASAIGLIPHVRRLRIHTRLPIVIPSRVQPELLEWLTGGRLQPIVVVHANHAQELSGEAVPAALEILRKAGVLLFNQAVLLAGINDSVAAQRELCLQLIRHGVVPYYVHQLDRVQGAAHFEVDPQRGRTIMRQLRQQLPGYAVPRYVVEEPGQPHKTLWV